MPVMNLVRVLVVCALVPACAATYPQQAQGMPLDKQLSPGHSVEALTVR